MSSTIGKIIKYTAEDAIKVKKKGRFKLEGIKIRKTDKEKKPNMKQPQNA